MDMGVAVDRFERRETIKWPLASVLFSAAVRGGGIVNHFKAVFFSAFLFILPANVSALQTQLSQTQPSPSGSIALITLAAGTKIELVVTRPVWSKSAKAGDPVYAQASFPTVAGNSMAIPAGTYVEGTIEDVTRPTRKSNRAAIQVLFTKIIFANGYTVVLPGGMSAVPASVSATANLQPGQAETLIAINVQVTTANDLLLDNGAEIEMTLGAPLQLDAKQVAQSIPLSHTPQPAQFESATQCRTIPGSPGSPGSPDTVIPGSPGTPDTVIPGGPGMPDITIPGIPATPPTVIPGSPGTPDTPPTLCPPKPMVVSCTLVVRGTQSIDSQPAAAR